MKLPKLTSVQLDGLLYFSTGVFIAAQTAFAADEAYKYVNPVLLFWLRTVSGIFAQGCLAVKMFRSGRTNGALNPPTVKEPLTVQPKETP